MMNKPTVHDTFSFRVSHEELFYLLSTLELNTLPGLGRDPFNGISSQQKEHMLLAGFNSLRAKGWVQLVADEETPIVLDRLFVLPLLACSSAQKILFITVQFPQRQIEKLFVFQSENLIVSYQLIETGIYEFIVTAEYKGLPDFFLNYMNLNGSGNLKAKKQVQFSVTGSAVQKLMELQSKRDISGIMNLLTTNKVKNGDITKYISCLENIQYNVILNFADFPEKTKTVDEFQRRTISVLVSQDNIWTVESDVNGTLIFNNVSSGHFRELFNEWIGI